MKTFSTFKPILLLIIFLSIQYTYLQAQYNEPNNMSVAVPYTDGKAFSLMEYQNDLYLSDIDINTRNSIATLLFKRPDSVSSFQYDRPSPSVSIKKDNFVPIAADKAVLINDFLEIDMAPYQHEFLNMGVKIDSFYRYWFCGYYNLRETPVVQCGTTCFIGKPDDIKKGNYAVYGLNTCSKTNEIIYFLGWYEKKHLAKVWLSNGPVFYEFSKKYDSYQVMNTHLDNQKYIKEYITNKACKSGYIASYLNKFYVMFDHGGHDMSYVFPSNDQPGFKIQHLKGNVYQYLPQMADPEFYSQYGRPIPKIQLISEIIKEPMVFNFGKFNDPKGETVVLGERKPKIEAQNYIEFDIHRNITVNIPQFDDPKGNDITYNDVVSRWVVMGQIMQGGFVMRNICQTDGFNYFVQDKMSYGNSYFNSSIHKAVWNNREDSVKLLLQKDTACKYINSDLQSPLHFAALQNNKSIVKLLLDNGSKVYAPDNFCNTPLHMAAFAGGSEIINMLYNAGKKEANKFGIGINYTNRFGQTPLDIAIANENLEAEKALLSLNAIASTWPMYGNNSFMYLCNKLSRPLNWKNWQKNYKMAELLFKNAYWGREGFTLPLIAQGDSIKDVKVLNMRFYEKSFENTDRKKIPYKQIFACSNTSYITFVFEIAFPKQTEKKEFSYKAVWRDCNAKEIYSSSFNTYIDSNWTSSCYFNSYGHSRLGAYWKPGVYSVEIYIGASKIAWNYFMVY